MELIQTTDPLTIIFGVTTGIAGFFAIRFFNQVQKLLNDTAELKATTQLILFRLQKLEEEKTIIKNYNNKQ